MSLLKLQTESLEEKQISEKYEARQNNERCAHGDLQDLKMTTSNFYNYNLHVRACRV